MMNDPLITRSIPLPTPVKQPNAASLPPGLVEKAKELEGVFLNTLMKEMFEGLDTEGSFGGGYAEQTWRSMQAEQLASEVANSGGFGLADDIVRHLLSAQEALPPSQP